MSITTTTTAFSIQEPEKGWSAKDESAKKKNENCDAVNSSCVMFDDGDDYDGGERSDGEPLPCLLVFRRLTAPFCPFDVRIMLNIPKQTHPTLADPERIYISHINRDLIGSWRVPQIECEKSETSDKRHSHRTVMHIRSQHFVNPNPFTLCERRMQSA